MTNRFRHESGVGVVDNGRQGAVVVQKHHDLLSLRGAHDLLELAQRRWMFSLHVQTYSTVHMNIYTYNKSVN
jgi:hypothetical protein